MAEPTLRDLVTERVTCRDCAGDGFILWDAPDVDARCAQCGGSGEIEVCAFCHDDWDDEYSCPRCLGRHKVKE